MIPKAYKLTLTLANGGTVATASNVEIRGRLVGYSLTTPDLSGTNTTTLAIVDAYSVTVYSKATIAESTTTTAFVDANNHPFRIPLVGPLTITCTASGTQTGAVNYTLVVYYE